MHQIDQKVKSRVSGGVLFRMSQKTSIALSLKYQTREVNYDNGNWPNAYQRLGLPLSQAF